MTSIQESENFCIKLVVLVRFLNANEHINLMKLRQTNDYYIKPFFS